MGGGGPAASEAPTTLVTAGKGGWEEGRRGWGDGVEREEVIQWDRERKGSARATPHSTGNLSISITLSLLPRFCL